MSEILSKIASCIEFGKINKSSPFPTQMIGQDGADELTKQALNEGIKAQQILTDGLMAGMEKIEIKFRENEIFVPQILMAAKAMNAAMAHLKPYFLLGEVKQKGTFIIGTVEGDRHDVGKNLVSMMVEGNGWEVIDLGTDVKAEQFVAAVKKHKKAFVALSAQLTTTMVNMEKITKAIKAAVPGTKVIVGGAPVTDDFRARIGADAYSADLQDLLDYLNASV